MLRQIITVALLAGVWCVYADEAQEAVHEASPRPVFKVDVVEKVTAAVNYRHRSGATRIDFVGTPLMPKASGQAKVESKQGYIRVQANFNQIAPAIRFGAEYLTFVLWAITPEGRAANLGEIHIKNGRGKLDVTTELQVFGLVVTAEPYFAVRQPSDLVVMENEIRPDTLGKWDVIDAKYELLKRGQYRAMSNPLSLTLDPKIPLELYEARNAIQISRSMGADEYAGEIFLKAERALRQAEAYLARNEKKPVAMLAREAVQTAEDAREIAVRRREQARLKQEREEAAQREAAAKAEAEEEARRRAEEERLRKEQEAVVLAARKKAEAEAEQRKRLEAELAEERRRAEEAAEEAERAMARLKERTASFGEERAKWEQERTRRETDQAERLKRIKALERAELRVRIYSQVSRVLFTRDTADGLAVEIPADLFERGDTSLTAEGREKLAMVAGILLANAGLGLTTPLQTATATASDADALEAGRTETVRSYLIERGLVDSRLWEPLRVDYDTAGEGMDSELPLAEEPVTVVIVGSPIEVSEELEAEEF